MRGYARNGVDGRTVVMEASRVTDAIRLKHTACNADYFDET
jgi:hypothetical protein